MSEYKIELGIGLRDNDFNSIKDKIKSIETDDIKIKLNTSTVDTQIEKIEAKLKGLSDIKLDFGTDIKIDGDSAIKSAQQIGKQIGETTTKAAKQTLNLDGVIDKQVLSLMKEYNIVGDKTSKAFKEIKQAVVSYRNALKGIDNVGSNDVFGSFSNVSDLRRVADVIDSHVKKSVDNATESYGKLLNKIRETNSAVLRGEGQKISLPDGMKSIWGSESNSKRSQLGAAFTFEKGHREFEDYIGEIYSLTGDISKANTAIDKAIELYERLEVAKGRATFSSDESPRQRQAEIADIEKNIAIAFSEIEKAEQKLIQSSNSATDAIVQDSKRQQEAIKANIGVKEAEIEQKKKRIQELNKEIDELSILMNDPNGISDNAKMGYESAISIKRMEQSELSSDIKQIETALNGAEQQAKQTANAIQSVSKQTSLIRDDVDFQKKFTSGNQSAKEAQQYFQNLLAEEKAVVSVKESFDNSIGDDKSLKSFTVSVQRASGEVEKFHYAMSETDRDNRFLYQGGSVSDSNVEKQLEARIKKANDLQIQLDKIKSGYSDMGAERPIKNQDHIASLDEQYKKVEKAIDDVRNADSATSASMISNAEKQKAVLESMVKEYKNADNVSNSLKGTNLEAGIQIRKEELGKLKAQASDFPQMINTIEELDRAIEGIGDKPSLDSFTDKLKVARAELAKVKAETIATNRKEKVGIDVSGITSQIANIQRISPEIDNFETEIDGAKVSVRSLLDDLSKVNTSSDFSVVRARFKAFEEAAEAAGIAVREIAKNAKTVNEIKIKLNDTGFNGFEQEVKRAHEAAEKLSASTPQLESALKQLDVAMSSVYSAEQSGDVQKLINANEKYENSLKQVNSQLKLLQKEEEKAYKAEMLSQKKAALNSEMEIWLKENTRAAKDFGEEIRRLQASLNGLDDSGVRLAGQQFKNLTKQAQVMGKTGLSVFDKLKSKAKEYAAYLSAAEIFMYAEQAFMSMFEQVKLIDSAMTELKKVTDETDASYDQFLTNAASRAKEIGTTIDGLVSSTADFARLGYDFVDAQGLAGVANIYAVVGDEIEGVEGATESLISTMAAFKGEMNGMSNTDFAMSIIDRFNEIGNNFSISSGGIGEALERSASSLMAANNTIDESIALITAANSVVQSPEQVGNAFKTISMRIRGKFVPIYNESYSLCYA